jgi:hypothetical protein
LQDHPTLTNLLERARRRLFGQLVLDKGALALVIGMGGAILLLLTGTQILDWYWPVLLVAASLGVGIYAVRKSLPSFYKLAQLIDRRLGLADVLSTAIHFAAHPELGREAICESQRRTAEVVAQTVDVNQALPGRRSRYLLPATALVLVAFGLFAVRYAVTGSLSLEPSLLQIAYDSFFGAPPQQLAKNQAKNLKMTQEPFDPGNPDAQSTSTDQQPPEDLLDAKESADTANPAGDDNAKQAADKEGDKNAGDSEKQGQDKGDSKDGKQGDKGDSKDGQQKEGGNQDKQGNPSDGGVLNKIKDALANMMNKMKPNSADKSQQQTAKNQPNEKGDKGQKGDNQKQDSQKDGAEPNPENSDGDQNQSDDAKASDQPGKPSSQESASGAGSKDGDKAAKDAKALEAMGKISEVLGKRSATVTGEMMIEVDTTKQTLKTPWADRQAGHTEAGGEIHREEVPLIFQPFVERYFEEIRKTPPAAKPASTPPRN